jgi:uncharacterized membrane protein YedE/YeeE
MMEAGVQVLSIALVAWIGFASHRASLCPVRAVGEWMAKGQPRMLAAFLKAAAWAAAVSGLIGAMHPAAGPSPQVGSPILLALAGGFLFGIGATINGGCSLSTLQRLADGELSMVLTFAAYCVAAMAWTVADGVFHLGALETVIAPRASATYVLPLIALWLRDPAGHPCQPGQVLLRRALEPGQPGGRLAGGPPVPFSEPVRIGRVPLSNV